MIRRITLISLLSLAAAGVGCKSAGTQASMGAMRSTPVLLSLGAGDSLGQRVYLNDMVIAAREGSLDVAVTAVSDSSPLDLGE